MTDGHETRESALARAPRVGVHVYTRDDRELGAVKAVTADAFHVDVPLGRDFWLSNTLVLPPSGDLEAITIDCDADDLDAFKLPGPAGAVSDNPAADEAGDQFHSSAERARKREEMERGTRSP